MRDTKAGNLAVVMVAAAAGLYGQAGADVKLDTPQARVLALVLEPDQTLAVREPSMNRVLVFRDSAQVTLKGSAGKIEKIDVREGDARWDAAGSQSTIKNDAAQPIRFFEVELKGKAHEPAPVSKLDPTVVDAQHYKIEFENDQVRVLRIHYAPMEKGVLHEHILNRVVCYLNDQARVKAGDVRMAGAATHTEENTGDKPADRIAVELKF